MPVACRYGNVTLAVSIVADYWVIFLAGLWIFIFLFVYDIIYLLNAIVLSPGGSSAVHIYTQTIHKTTQNEQCIEQHNNLGECGAVPCLG